VGSSGELHHAFLPRGAAVASGTGTATRGRAFGDVGREIGEAWGSEIWDAVGEIRDAGT